MYAIRSYYEGGGGGGGGEGGDQGAQQHPTVGHRGAPSHQAQDQRQDHEAVKQEAAGHGGGVGGA